MRYLIAFWVSFNLLFATPPLAGNWQKMAYIEDGGSTIYAGYPTGDRECWIKGVFPVVNRIYLSHMKFNPDMTKVMVVERQTIENGHVEKFNMSKAKWEKVNQNDYDLAWSAVRYLQGN